MFAGADGVIVLPFGIGEFRVDELQRAETPHEWGAASPGSGQVFGFQREFAAEFVSNKGIA